MKGKRKQLMIILCFALICFGSYQIFIATSTNVVRSYPVQTGENKFRVVQDFDRKNKSYYIQIKDDNKELLIAYPVNIRERKRRIISDIYIYDKNDMWCIAPIYNYDKETIFCKKDDYLIPRDISPNQEFTNDLIEQEILNQRIVPDTKMNEFYKLGVYQENISRTIVIWDYRYLNVLNNNGLKRYKLSDDDIYNNRNNYLVNDIYVMPMIVRNRITELKLVNINNGRVRNMELRFPISTDSFIMGRDNYKLYWFDKDAKVQYKINVRNRSQVKQNEVMVLSDNEWKSVDSLKVRNDRIKFNQKSIKRLGELNTYTRTGPFNYLHSNNKIIMVDNETYQYPTLILEEEGLREVRFVRDEIYFIKGDTLYKQLWDGTRFPLVKWDEWNFNKNNIYFIGN